MYLSKLNRAYTYLSAAPGQAVQGKDFVRTLPCSQREAPAMFKSEGTYYLVTSGATGWDPNPARYATAKSVLGSWSDQGNPIVGAGAADTFRSQSTTVIPYDRANNKFIYMGDRWTPNDLANSPYVWMPMKFGEGGTLSIGPDAEWKLGDLKSYQRWTVDTVLPDHVWLRDTSNLPAKVAVTAGGRTQTLGVTWDATTVAQPGPAKVRDSRRWAHLHPLRPRRTAQPPVRRERGWRRHRRLEANCRGGGDGGRSTELRPRAADRG